MRRLLASIVTCALLLGAAAPAWASGRLPSGIAKVSITVTFPELKGATARRPVRRTLTRAAAVRQAVAATNALPVAKVRVMCPMYLRLGPELTVVFRNARGSAVASASVEVSQGSKGNSGASPCFPIRFSRSGTTSNLLGNSWVRLMGKLAGTSIS